MQAIRTEADRRWVQCAQLGGLSLLLFASLAVFWPGLTGPFLLDDLFNLRLLGAAGGIDDWADLLRFLMTGPAGPTGRPVSLLSFAINAQDWPADPWPFKLTNLLIHLLNGALVYVLAKRLARYAGTAPVRAGWLAMLAAGLWLLHPIQITAVLYVVQRMTELSALFVLCGLHGYLYGRGVAAGRPRRGLVIMTLSLGLGGLLATLSKENGALLPVYILAAEATLLTAASAPRRPPGWRIWSGLCLWLPALAILGYLAWRFVGATGPGQREFTVAERLLTQPRVLAEYLELILLPFWQHPTLMADAFQHSSGLWRPPSTALALLLLLCAFAGALWARRRAPVLAFAVLWYLGGHLLESSSLALELYFEHRNYLPLFGPVFAAAWYVSVLARWRPATGLLVATLLLAAVAIPTALEARIWRSEASLAMAWSERHPESARAQQMLGKYYLDQGRADQTQALMLAAEENLPDHLGIELQLFQFRCAQRAVTPAHVAELMQDAAVSPYAESVFSSLDGLMRPAALGVCPPFNRTSMIALLETIAANPRYAGGQGLRKLHFHSAVLHAVAGDYEPAVAAAHRAYAAQPSEQVAYNAALWRYQNSEPEAALRWIERAHAAAEPESLAVRWFFEAQKSRNAARVDELEVKIRQALQGQGG